MHKLPWLKIAHLSHHHRQQGIACNIERFSGNPCFRLFRYGDWMSIQGAHFSLQMAGSQTYSGKSTSQLICSNHKTDLSNNNISG